MHKPLKPYHQEALALRWQGNRYHEIAKIIREKYKNSINPQTVRWWFMQGGILHDKYSDYVAERWLKGPRPDPYPVIPIRTED